MSSDPFRQLIRACAQDAPSWDHLDTRALPVQLPATGEPYGRAPLFRDDEGEILLVNWRNGMPCAPHDHSAASGFIFLVSGTLFETHWHFDGHALHEGAQSSYRAPNIIRIEHDCIHDMRAQDNCVGVHVYLPRISGMRVFDSARRETLRVSDDCGAWIPTDPRLILSRDRWP